MGGGGRDDEQVQLHLMCTFCGDLFDGEGDGYE